MRPCDEEEEGEEEKREEGEEVVGQLYSRERGVILEPAKSPTLR